MTAGRHLILVGLMGVGKTTVGRACAARLDRPFVDIDDRIVEAAGASIPDIFATDGEPRFRAIERAMIARACRSRARAVIACGGGAVLDADNRRRLRESGFVVWLDAPPEELARRVGDGDGRPLLAAGTPAHALTALAEARRPAYEAVADEIVATEGRGVDEVAGAVLAAFSREKTAPGTVEVREKGEAPR